MKEKFTVSGMSCAACSAGIERVVRRLKGVSRADVSLMDECMTVEYDETLSKREDIFNAVIKLGYGISDYDQNVLQERKPEPNKLKKRFFLSLAFLLPLMYFSMGGMVGLPQPSEKVSVTLQMLLALGVIVIDFKFFTVNELCKPKVCYVQHRGFAPLFASKAMLHYFEESEQLSITFK